MSGTIIVKRLNNEIKKNSKKLPYGIEVYPDENDIFVWKATITGGKDTYYEGLKFDLIINIIDSYPKNPPIVKFITSVYHPNIDIKTGGICLTTLGSGWSPALTIVKLLVSIQSLLAEPNSDHGLNPGACSLYLKDKDKFKKTVLDHHNKKLKTLAK